MNKALSLFEIPHFAKLTDRFIGFDDLFSEMNATMNTKMDMGFPPYDIYTEDVPVSIKNSKGKLVEEKVENHTFIKFALAGIKKSDIKVQFDENVLTVYNEKDNSEEEKISNEDCLKVISNQRNVITQEELDRFHKFQLGEEL